MVEIKEGQSFPIETIKASQGLTFKGKPITFEVVNEEERVYQGKTELSDEDLNAGNLYVDVVTVQFPVTQGVIRVSQEAPKQLEEDFKDLSDAEKLTKLNSLQYTLNRSEPRQIASGNLESTIGQQAVKSLDKKQQEKQKESGTSNVIEQDKSAKQKIEDKARQEENKKNAEHSATVNKMTIADIQKDTDSKTNITKTTTNAQEIKKEEKK